jgi:hypothetical protein
VFHVAYESFMKYEDCMVIRKFDRLLFSFCVASTLKVVARDFSKTLLPSMKVGIAHEISIDQPCIQE